MEPVWSTRVTPEIWAHNVGDAADFGGGREFVNRGLLQMPAFPEGFDGDIEADLAAELEAVGH